MKNYCSPSTQLNSCPVENPFSLNLPFIHKKYYPEWQYLRRNKWHNFTIIFEGFPKHCSTFDPKEEIPEPGGFAKLDIHRNESDIYQIKF